MVLTINPISPVTVVAQEAADGTPTLVLQPGTVVSAQVQNVLAADLVRIAIANLSIDVATEVPLQAGQNLQLAVSQTDSGVVRLAVVGQGAGAASADVAGLASDAPLGAAATPATAAVPSNDPLTPLQRIAVSVASEHAAAQQQSLAPLFADLNAIASSDSLPPALRAAVAQVLAQQTSLDDNLTGADIRQAMQKSGLLLEASFAAGTAPASGMPDLKAALIVLRQALATVIDGAGSSTPPPVQPAVSGQPAGAAKPMETPASPMLVPSLPTDGEGLDVRLPSALSQQILAQQTAAGASGGGLLANALSNGPQSVASAIALSVLQAALPEIRRTAGNASAGAANVQDVQREGIVTRTNAPPPFRGALPSAQPIAAPSIAPDAPLASIAHRLLDDTDAAIARQTLLQVASLPDRADASASRIDPSMPRWNFEIPFTTAQGTAMAQFEIARDGGGRDSEAARRIWRARFSLDVEPAGPVHALITLSGERTSVRMWAERPATAAQLRAGAGELSQALSAAELQPGDIVIRDGAPPMAQPAKAGHFLDRAS
jgi:Flagellar hook-length control protein FliK